LKRSRSATPALEDHDTRKHLLNTLALASKQLDAAQQLDPDAILDGQDDKDVPYRYSINELKAEALLLEGITHQTYDLILILVRVIERRRWRGWASIHNHNACALLWCRPRATRNAQRNKRVG